MDGHADRRVASLRLASPVQFRDRWQGKVAAIEVDEEWEVLNLIVKRGALRWSASVKLPFSAATHWSDGRVTFDCTSRQAFAREVPPVAAPARPLSRQTPLSAAGATLDGLLVEPGGRRLATDIIIRHGRDKNRVPVEEVSFQGRVLHVTSHGENLQIHLTDHEIAIRAREALALTRVLTGEERRTVSMGVSSGVVTVRGNVLTKNTKQGLEQAMSGLAQVATIRIEVVDDLDLELAVGRALDRAGLTRVARVYARSSLGDVTLYGEAPSPRTAEDIVRAVSALPGVHSARSLLQLAQPQTAPRP